MPTNGSGRKRRLKRLAIILGVAMVLAMISTVYLVHYYGEARSTVEQPGRIHAVKIHRRTVYLSNNEYASVLVTHGIVVILIGMFIGTTFKATLAKS
jgi:hypothetical protein